MRTVEQIGNTALLKRKKTMFLCSKRHQNNIQIERALRDNRLLIMEGLGLISKQLEEVKKMAFA